MHDLREDLDPVWRATSRLSGASDGARAVMFVSARSGEGVTSMAASFACMAARRAEKPVWLVDLDLRNNTAYEAFAKRFARDVGPPARAYDASLREAPIYKISPRIADGRQEKLLTAHDIKGLPLLVTRFRSDRLKPGQSVILQDSPGWWNALRGLAGWVVVDAPALEASAAALTMASAVDGVILVVEADRTRPADIDAARREIEAKRGRVLGVVMNRVRGDARFAERFSA